MGSIPHCQNKKREEANYSFNCETTETEVTSGILTQIQYTFISQVYELRDIIFPSGLEL